jgi:adenylate kinase family enzyme
MSSARLTKMQRIAVVGSGGAGMTTFATQFARRTGLPVVHLDHLDWRPGWVETPSEEWRTVVEEHLEGERWIVDGNYARTFDIRFERADTVIVLEMSRWRCLARVLRRTLLNHGKPVQAADCPERVDAEFLRWVWRFPKESGPLLEQAIERHGATLSVVRQRSSFEVRRYLRGSAK